MPSQEKYTDPELREQVKEEIKQADKRGQSGQWSARKAQVMATEYKKRGGGYTTDKESEEEWQTKDCKGEARQDDGSRKRYLPKKAWEQMDKAQKEQTEQKKQEASNKGKQFADNTQKASDSRKKAAGDGAKELDGKNDTSQIDKCNGDHDGTDLGDNDDEYEEYEAEGDEDEDEDVGSNDGEMEVDGDERGSKPTQKAGRKRGRKAKEEDNDTNKSRRGNGGKGKNTHGSKHDSHEEPAQRGSADRLPNVGDRVSWKAMPGWVHGKLVEIVTNKKSVKGKDVKGSEKDPRFVLEADSGKICVHKPETCYYD